jgi:NADPH-dependent curcumin reductase CurA
LTLIEQLPDEVGVYVEEVGPTAVQDIIDAHAEGASVYECGREISGAHVWVHRLYVSKYNNL